MAGSIPAGWDFTELIIDTGDDRFEVTLAFPAEDNGDESTDR
jgi:hypothetical protein